MNERIYLDNNATTPLDPTAKEAMLKELDSFPKNPSSVHFFGREGKKILADCRRKIAEYLKVEPGEIFFTSGGTEGLNLLIRGALPSSFGRVIASPIDHAAVYQTLEALRLSGQIGLTFLPIDPFGAPTATALEKVLRSKANLIVLSAANSETGVKIDREAIAEVARRADIPLILDGVALLGKEPLTLPKGICAMAFSGHKFHGPQGIGFVYIRSKFKVRPLLTGGGQEKTLRSGTENLIGIVGMTQALTAFDPHRTQVQIDLLRSQFERDLKKALPEIAVNGMGTRLCNTSHLYFPGVDAESLLMALDLEGIATSYGSACASGSLELSRPLLNMGYSRERVSSSLRFSFSRMNTQKELKKATQILISLVHKLRVPLTKA